jgi:hypothetical protein
MSWTIKGNGTGEDLLYSQAGTPSLDLRFAATKSLNDYVSGNNLITFTRATSWYVCRQRWGVAVGGDELAADGVRSLSDAAWTPLSVPAAVTANNAIAPNGTLTADLITGVSAAGDQLRQVVTLLNSTVYTYSIYIKQNTTLLTRIGLFNATTSAWMGAVDIAWVAGGAVHLLNHWISVKHFLCSRG